MAALIFVNLIAGDLAAALAVHRLLRQIADQHDYPYALAWRLNLEGLVHFFRHELRSAVSCLGRAVEQRHNLQRRAAADAMAGLALVHEALGHKGEADATLDLLLDDAGIHADPGSLVVAESCRQRLEVLRRGAGAGLPRAAASPAAEAMIWWLEIPAVSRCRLLLAEGSASSVEEAEKLLAECLELNRRHHNVRQEIEILPLLALARQRRGSAEDARGLLERAVTLAGWIRPFVEPGPAVVELLLRLEPRLAEGDFVRRILAAGEAAAMPEPDVRDAPPPAATERPAADLTLRERDVLELLAQRLRDKEIAAALGVSTVTVKSHLRQRERALGAPQPRRFRRHLRGEL